MSVLSYIKKEDFWCHKGRNSWNFKKRRSQGLKKATPELNFSISDLALSWNNYSRDPEVLIRHLLYSLCSVDRRLERAHFKYHECRCDQQVWGFCWLTIDILLFAISVLAAKRQIYLFFITLNIYSAHQAYRIHFDIILCIYYNIFIHHDGHLNCLKTFTIMDNPIMDIVVHISLCTRVRVS